MLYRDDIMTKEIDMETFNRMPYARGSAKHKNNMKKVILDKFGTMKPVPWEKVKNYLVKKGYTPNNLIGHIASLKKQYKGFRHELKFDGKQKWIVFYDEKV